MMFSGTNNETVLIDVTRNKHCWLSECEMGEEKVNFLLISEVYSLRLTIEKSISFENVQSMTAAGSLLILKRSPKKGATV